MIQGGKIVDVNGEKHKVILDDEGDFRYIKLRDEELEVVNHHPEVINAENEPPTLIKDTNDQLKFVDEAITHWQGMKEGAQTDKDRVIAEASLDTYQAIRLTFFGDIC